MSHGVNEQRYRHERSGSHVTERYQNAIFGRGRVFAEDTTLSRMFPWRDALVNVKASTLIRWHRQGFQLFWRWKSKPMGRPRLPRDLRRLIREMATENATWGEERIANDLKLKLGMRIQRTRQECHAQFDSAEQCFEKIKIGPRKFFMLQTGPNRVRCGTWGSLRLTFSVPLPVRRMTRFTGDASHDQIPAFPKNLKLGPTRTLRNGELGCSFAGPPGGQLLDAPGDHRTRDEPRSSP